MNLEDYSKQYGIDHIVDDYDEDKYTVWNYIIFENGWIASILPPAYDDMWSVAMCDYNGYFDWEILDSFGAKAGRFKCDTEDAAIEACEIIRSINGPDDFYKARNSKKS